MPIAYRTCPLCEATCGLELHLAEDGQRVELVRGDKDDVFSKGYLCPKGTAIKALELDPDRLRVPQIRDRVTDSWRDASWEEAFGLIAERLPAILDAHGRDALAVYLGNPNAHNLSGLLFGRVMLQAARTRNVYSASTVDQMPKQVSAGLMFGAALSIPVADIDHTDYLLMLGANPFASNGSVMTCPDFPGRLEALRARGGRLVVVDPRRSKTAEAADEWVAVKPGGDAFLLFGIVHTLFAEGLADPGAHVGAHLEGLDQVRSLAEPFTPEACAPHAGVDAETIRRLARELAGAPTAAVYGRIGTCLNDFGTISSWLVDVVNILTGNLDRRGGAMFALPAAGGANVGGTTGVGRGVRFGRRASRVRNLPEVFGELPAVALAEEITTPGEGQVRAMITVAGNPVVSNPGAERLDAALATLEFMVSIDIYRNETTRHADVILPPEPILAKSHFDVALYGLAVRNVANYSPPVHDVAPGEWREWEVLARLAGILQGQGADADVDGIDGVVIGGLVDAATRRPGAVQGRAPEELLGELSKGGRRGPERILDLMLRTGPYGDGFGANPGGLSLDQLIAHPHGIDFGPLQPRLPEVLRTPSGKVEMAPEMIVADVERLMAALGSDGADGGSGTGLVLVGRRDLRSNNSWMHNLRVLVKGKARCTVHVHPADAAAHGVVDGALVTVRSAHGAVRLAAEVTDGIRPGVVSIPHGWGHDMDGVNLGVAREFAGVNTNVLAGVDRFDPLSGNAALNGIPVELVAG